MSPPKTFCVARSKDQVVYWATINEPATSRLISRATTWWIRLKAPPVLRDGQVFKAVEVVSAITIDTPVIEAGEEVSVSPITIDGPAIEAGKLNQQSSKSQLENGDWPLIENGDRPTSQADEEEPNRDSSIFESENGDGPLIENGDCPTSQADEEEPNRDSSILESENGDWPLIENGDRPTSQAVAIDGPAIEAGELHQSSSISESEIGVWPPIENDNRPTSEVDEEQGNRNSSISESVNEVWPLLESDDDLASQAGEEQVNRIASEFECQNGVEAVIVPAKPKKKKSRFSLMARSVGSKVCRVLIAMSNVMASTTPFAICQSNV